MDVQKLYRVADDILKEITANDVAGLFANLSSYISQNTTASLDSATETQEKLNAVFDSSVTNQYAPSYREIVQQLDATNYVGEGGKIALTQILSGSPLSLVANLQSHIENFNQVVDKLRRLTESLNAINITPYQSDLFEIGYVIPTDLNDLSYISKRLTYYSKFISLSSAIAGEKDTVIRLERVSNGSLEFFVVGSIAVAKVVDKVLSRVVELYKELETIKQMKADTENKMAQTLKTKADILKALVATEKELSEKFVDNTVKDVMSDYSGDKDSKQEIKVQLGVTIKTLLDDIQNGIQVEITPPEVVQTGDVETSGDLTKTHANIKATNAELIGVYSLSKEDRRLPESLSATQEEEKELEKEIEVVADTKDETNEETDTPKDTSSKKPSKK